MPAFRNIIACFVLIALTAAAQVGSARAEPPPAAMVQPREGQTNRPSFSLHAKEELIPGLPSIVRAYVNTGTNRYSFLVPRSWRIHEARPGYILLANADLTGIITVRNVKTNFPSLDLSGGQTNNARFRRLVKREHPGAKILLEFPRMVADTRGRAFDVLWLNQAGLQQKIRTVFLPASFGVYEFKLSTDPQHFRKASYKLNNLLLSFCLSKDGELETTELSNLF